ncbi:hypothetical protein Hanom_Chr02g00126711 [Helianthus anomalus]
MIISGVDHVRPHVTSQGSTTRKAFVAHLAHVFQSFLITFIIRIQHFYINKGQNSDQET